MVTENDSYYQSHPVTTTKLTYGSIRRKEKKHLSSSTLSKPPRVPKPVLWTPVVDWNNSRLRPGPVCSTPNMTKPHIATSPAIHNLPIGHITSYHPTLDAPFHTVTHLPCWNMLLLKLGTSSQVPLQGPALEALRPIFPPMCKIIKL